VPHYAVVAAQAVIRRLVKCRQFEGTTGLLISPEYGTEFERRDATRNAKSFEQLTCHLLYRIATGLGFLLGIFMDYCSSQTVIAKTRSARSVWPIQTLARIEELLEIATSPHTDISRIIDELECLENFTM
jgi:hypothetical protein